MPHTLIRGFDGGLYVLLNTVKDLNIFYSNGMSEDYIAQKTTSDNKIILGKGAYGKVRFAMSLFLTKTSKPGDIICVKKFACKADTRQDKIYCLNLASQEYKKS